MRWPTLISLAILVILSVATYGWILDLYFTGIDTATLLEVNRFDQPGGFMKAFGQEIRDGVEPDVGFYRPWSGFAYGLSLAIFGLNPFLHHALDLLVHIVVVVLLFILLRHLGAGVLPAFGATLWFALHPIALEVLPAMARRADLWVVLFLLMAALGMLRVNARAPGGWPLLIVGGLLAPLSKETGLAVFILLPFLAMPSDRRRILWISLALVLPALIGRWLVLAGTGGYGGLTFWVLSLPRAALDMLDTARICGMQGARLLGLLLLLWMSFSALRKNDPTRRMIRLSLVWWAIQFAILALVEGVSTWYLYVSLPAVAMLMAAMMQQIQNSGAAPAGGWAFPSWIFPRMLATILLIAAILPSPLIRSYPEWKVASKLTEQWFAAVEQLPDELMQEQILVTGIPKRVNFEPSPRFRTRTASCLMDFSLSSWSKLSTGREMKLQWAGNVRLTSGDGPYSIHIDRSPSSGMIRLGIQGPATFEPMFEIPDFPMAIRSHTRAEMNLHGQPLFFWNGEGLQRWKDAAAEG